MCIRDRNELGHRYYTEKQLALFQRIKELKELGYQLKAIRTSLNQEEGLELKADEAGFLLEEDREHPVKASAGVLEEKTEHASLDEMDQEGAGTEEVHSRQKDKPAEARFKVLDGEGDVYKRQLLRTQKIDYYKYQTCVNG